MTALPIDPTDEQLKRKLIATAVRRPSSIRSPLQAAFQAGVEAERARAAAEMTEEWGTRRAENEAHETAAIKAPSEEYARVVAKDVSDEGYATRVVVRRLVGPWEVQS